MHVLGESVPPNIILMKNCLVTMSLARNNASKLVYITKKGPKNASNFCFGRQNSQTDVEVI